MHSFLPHLGQIFDEHYFHHFDILTFRFLLIEICFIFISIRNAKDILNQTHQWSSNPSLLIGQLLIFAQPPGSWPTGRRVGAAPNPPGHSFGEAPRAGREKPRGAGSVHNAVDAGQSSCVEGLDS